MFWDLLYFCSQSFAQRSYHSNKFVVSRRSGAAERKSQRESSSASSQYLGLGSPTGPPYPNRLHASPNHRATFSRYKCYANAGCRLCRRSGATGGAPSTAQCDSLRSNERPTCRTRRTAYAITVSFQQVRKRQSLALGCHQRKGWDESVVPRWPGRCGASGRRASRSTEGSGRRWTQVSRRKLTTCVILFLIAWLTR